RKNRIGEPLLSKSFVCTKASIRPITVLGFISGLGIGVSIQGLLGWLTIYDDWLYWLLGTLASVLLGLCFFYYNPVLLGLTASFSIFSLPVSVFLSLVSPLKMPFQGEGPGVGDVIGGLYFWSKLDALEFPFNYSKGIISWHWAMISNSKLYLDPVINSPGEPNLNSIVIGRSGSGKSMLTKRLVSSFSAKDYNVLVLDFHGEYTDILNNSIVVDFWNSNYYLDFRSIKESEEFKAQVIADAFRSIYNLGDRQYTMLYDALTDYFSIENTESLSKVIPRSLLSLSDASGFGDKSSIIGLAQYVRQLGYLFEGELPVNVLLEGKENIIIDLSKIPGMHLRVATAELVLRILYNTMTTASMSSRRLLVVEEAHHFNDKSILSKLYTESRKFGLAIISVTQNPKALSRDIVINSTTKLMFGMDEPENMDYIVRILVPSDGELNMFLRYTISSLPPGYALLSNKLLSNEIFLIKVF
ncbi:MAG: ATP-binding protein, partial [Desulfurococcales archaeon]|nr:ATP-binding protein [Desulfurococcales archaeon]